MSDEIAVEIDVVDRSETIILITTPVLTKSAEING
jgi:hypothetical protein